MNDHTTIFPPDALFILGAGRFGSRAAEILCSRQESTLWLIDKDECAFSRTRNLHISRIRKDAVEFLAGNFSSLSPSHRIVPSIPVHLAVEWLKAYCPQGDAVTQTAIPLDIGGLLPHTWMGSEGSLLVSYADFLCPEDCPEPVDACTVTGEKRMPLYERLAGMSPGGYQVHIIRSKQIAPGVGYYEVRDLIHLLDRLRKHPAGKWLVGTACRCHGTVTAVSVDFRHCC